MKDALSDDFTERAGTALQVWVDLECANLDRQRNGVRHYVVPQMYKPNEAPDMRSPAIYAVPRTRVVSDDQFEHAKKRLQEPLGFLADELHKRKDLYATSLTLLLYRHLYAGHLEPYMGQILNDLHLDQDPLRYICPRRAKQLGSGTSEGANDPADGA